MTEPIEPRLVPGERGPDLVLSRRLAARIDDVWATLTDPARTAGWYGPWEGEGGAGRSIRVRMLYEEGQPWLPLCVDACERPTHLAVSMVEGAGDWRLEVVLADLAGTTHLSLIHHLSGVDGLAEIGPGWEYYLDLFTAALHEQPLASPPEFTDYYPARSARYAALAEGYPPRTR